MLKTLLASTLIVALFAFAAATAADHEHEHEPMPTKAAVCVLMPMSGSHASGVVTLMQEKDGVHLTGEIKGLSPGMHGFHIHAYGDLRKDDGTSAGGHFGAEGHKHGGPESAEHHAGDLGNIKAGDNGVAAVDLVSKDLKLHFIVGRSIVVHAKADDLKTDPSGNSGDRIAVGVIGVANTDPPKK